MRSFGTISPDGSVAGRPGGAEIATSRIAVLVLLAGLLVAAILHPPSDYRVPKTTDQDRRITAIHESGHAVLAEALPAGGAIAEITIVSRWGMLGSVQRVPAAAEMDARARRERRMAELVIAQGGLIAEELLLGAEPDTGAATSDIKAAEKIAFELLGGQAAGLSADEAEAGVARLMAAAESRARALLAAREDALHRLAGALLEHQTLSGADVSAILTRE